MMKNLISAAFGACAMLATASAGAETLDVTYTDTDVTVTWEQSSNPTPNYYDLGGYTDVPVWNVTGNYNAIGISTSDVFYFSAGEGGGWGPIFGPQDYSGSEAAPVFSAGAQTGFYYTPGSNATLTYSAVPEVSTWVMLLAGFAGLGFVGYRRNHKALSAA